MSAYPEHEPPAAQSAEAIQQGGDAQKREEPEELKFNINVIWSGVAAATFALSLCMVILNRSEVALGRGGVLGEILFPVHVFVCVVSAAGTVAAVLHALKEAAEAAVSKALR